MTKLNKRSVDAADPRETEWFLWDGELRGFGLRVRRSGRKFYVVQYRFKGRTRRIMLGEHGRLTPDQARAKAFATLNAVAHGRDPAEARDIDRQAMTLKEFIREIYLPDANRGLVTYRGRPKKPGTLVVDRGRIERHILPLLGSRKVRDISALDCGQFIVDVAAGKTAADIKTRPRGRAIVDGGPGTARRTAGLLGGIFSYAVIKHLRDDNPMRGVDRRFADRVRDRALTPDEYSRLGYALSHPDVLRSQHLSATAAIRLLALTGLRKSEALNMRRRDFDPVARLVKLEDTKTGAQVRAIGRAAAAVLEDHPSGQSDLVFWGTSWGKSFIGLPKAFARVCAAAKIKGVTLHTLRHSYATVASELGYSEFVIAGLLGHRAGSVTARYSHLPDTALLAAADAVSLEIELRMSSAQTGDSDLGVPSLTAIDDHISDDAIRRLATIGRLPKDADLDRFGQDIRQAVAGYPATRETPPQQKERQFHDVAAAIEVCDQAKLDTAVQRLSPDIRKIFDSFDNSTLDRFGPRGSLARWRALLWRAMVTEPQAPRRTRRGRPTQSRRIQLYGTPPALPGRPVRWQEQWLTAVVIDAWRHSTGRKVPSVVSRSRDRNPSPLIALIDAVLKCVGYREHTAAILFDTWRRDWANFQS
jgi:integrase